MTTIACNTATAPRQMMIVRIEPVKTLYARGDTVILTLRNVGSAGAAFSVCGSKLQRLSYGRWIDVDTPERPCTLSIQSLPIGATADGTAGVLPLDLGAGTYRYEVALLRTETMELLAESMRASAAFIVKP